MLVLVSLSIMGFCVASSQVGIPSHTSCNLNRLSGNAAWLSVNWVSHPPDKAAIIQLANNATERRLSYLFPFTTYARPDGTFSPTFGFLKDFVSIFRQENRTARILPWIGVPTINRRRFGPPGYIDLMNEAERRSIAQLAASLISDASSDGVHLDVEHVNDGDLGFLLLLQDVRQAIGSDVVLSVAANNWLPVGLNDFPVIDGYKWTGAYYQEVASHVDQIVVMSYDSIMPSAFLYRLWLAEQVKGISRSLARSNVELLMGLTVSREKTLTHRPAAENMLSGLRGICAARNEIFPEAHSVDGIAIYAEWEADEDDWHLWQEWVSHQ